jgi:hypothetical protein
MLEKRPSSAPIADPASSDILLVDRASGDRRFNLGRRVTLRTPAKTCDITILHYPDSVLKLVSYQVDSHGNAFDIELTEARMPILARPSGANGMINHPQQSILSDRAQRLQRQE